MQRWKRSLRKRGKTKERVRRGTHNRRKARKRDERNVGRREERVQDEDGIRSDIINDFSVIISRFHWSWLASSSTTYLLLPQVAVSLCKNFALMSIHRLSVVNLPQSNPFFNDFVFLIEISMYVHVSSLLFHALSFMEIWVCMYIRVQK